MAIVCQDRLLRSTVLFIMHMTFVINLLFTIAYYANKSA